MGKPIIKRFRRILHLFLIYPLLLPLIFCSCATSYREYPASLNQDSLRAEELFARGDYVQALDNYETWVCSSLQHPLYIVYLSWLSRLMI